MKFHALAALAALAASAAVADSATKAAAATTAPAETSPNPAARNPANPTLAAWRETRFGLFIHWGIYSVAGRGEWLMFSERMDLRDYAKLADQFTASRYDPAAWAALAKEAGMGYMVMTTRHHDGFSLWDSPASHGNFTSVHSAAKRDLVAEYTRACRDAGLLVGFYYSPLDWRFPGFFFPDLYRENAEAMRDQTYAQVQELLTRYGKVDILWYDGGGDDWLGFGGIDWGKEGWANRKKRPAHEKPLWEPAKLQQIVRRLQPDIITNERSGTGHDMTDFYSREWSVGDYDDTFPWEKCATLSGTWGYNPHAKTRTLGYLLNELSQTVCRDGNFLLNVGPKEDGTLSKDETARLREIGQWMKVNGEAIHRTRGGPLRPTAHYGTTHCGDTVYLHIWSWPESGVLTLGELPRALDSATVLSGDAVTCATEGTGSLTLTRTGDQAQGLPTIVKLTHNSNSP